MRFKRFFRAFSTSLKAYALGEQEAMSGRSRYFLNPFEDYVPGAIFTVDYNYVRKDIMNNIDLCFDHQKCAHRGIEGGLYIGVIGNAYPYYHLARKKKFEDMRSEFLEKATAIVTAGVKEARRTKSREPADECGFLLGKSGIYALAAAVYHETGDDAMADECIQDFIKVGVHCVPLSFASFGGDELLVGRAGYLNGALWLNKRFGNQVIPNDLLFALCDSMIESGKAYSEAKGYYCPLVYHYYKTEYLGAAHGLSSILQMIISCPGYLDQNKQADGLVKKSVDFLLTLQNELGNFPCALDEVGENARATRDELVHWCHGGPGIVYLLGKAYLRWNLASYMDAALKVGDLTWERGLLRKGPGICHGVAGSGYVFLYLHSLKKDPRHLHRAVEFGKWFFKPEFKKSRVPDCPYSLYEGYAGTICFLADLMEPETGSFPFFDV